MEYGVQVFRSWYVEVEEVRGGPTIQCTCTVGAREATVTGTSSARLCASLVLAGWRRERRQYTRPLSPSSPSTTLSLSVASPSVRAGDVATARVERLASRVRHDTTQRSQSFAERGGQTPRHAGERGGREEGGSAGAAATGRATQCMKKMIRRK